MSGKMIKRISKVATQNCRHKFDKDGNMLSDVERVGSGTFRYMEGSYQRVYKDLKKVYVPA